MKTLVQVILWALFCTEGTAPEDLRQEGSRSVNWQKGILVTEWAECGWEGRVDNESKRPMLKLNLPGETDCTRSHVVVRRMGKR